MLVLLLSLLATKYAAGEGYSHFNQQQPIRVVPHYIPASPPEIKPIDLTDDIYNSDFWINPNSHIYYNFEQVRRDQQTQVENRNETVGAYLHNRPRKTTTTPKPVQTSAPMVQEYNDDEGNNWNLNQYSAPMPTTTVPIPRPTDAAPLWQDVLANEQPAYPQYPARFLIRTEHQNVPPQSQFVPSQPQYEPTQAPEMPTLAPYMPTERPQQTWYDPSPTHTRKTVRLPHATPASQFVPAYHSRAALELSTSTSQMNDIPIQSEPSQPAKGRGHSNRGNHKFNWAEADPTEATPIISATQRVGLSAANPPPPVPTLSAWHGDNFGK